MMGWAAANAPAAPSCSGLASDLQYASEGMQRYADGVQSVPIAKASRGSETAEAALARLTTAYSTAVSCIGALHRASAIIEAADRKKRDNTKDQKVDGGVGDAALIRHLTGENDFGDRTDQVDQPNIPDAIVDVTSNEHEVQLVTVAAANIISTANDNNKSMNQLIRAAQAARSLLEESVLLDPLVLPLTPTLCCALAESSGNVAQRTESNNSNISKDASMKNEYEHRKELIFDVTMGRLDSLRSSTTATLTSSTQKANLKKLTYSSLVNYADLLMMCSCISIVAASSPSEEKELKRMTVLDRGVVKVLPQFKVQRCWTSENLTTSIQLALAAYVDASDIDRSDPTNWLKLASAARAFGRAGIATPVVSTKDGTIPADNDEEGPIPQPYLFTRLERYALERGLEALPDDTPPNRLLLRALREQEELETLNSSSSTSCKSRGPAIEAIPKRKNPGEPNEILIELTRYSWLTLGRSLMRACREGSRAFLKPKDSDSHAMLYRRCSPSSFLPLNYGSLKVKLYVSPILAIPPTALAAVCEFLGGKDSSDLSTDVKRLEATCRALSAAIISIRAIVEECSNQKRSRNLGNVSALPPSTSSIAVIPPSDSSAEKMPAATPEKETVTNRSSKRVRSRQISSGKQAERDAKRSSVEYCLVGALFGCKVGHPSYRKALETRINWDSIPTFASVTGAANYTPPRGLLLSSGIVSPSSKRETIESQAVAWMGKSSLLSFISDWSGDNAGPFDVLYGLLLHLATHVEVVFSYESTGTVMLSSCVLDCFNLLLNRCGHLARPVLTPAWVGPAALQSDTDLCQCVNGCAINLLLAELMMKRCESYNKDVNEYEFDLSALSFMIPKLLAWSSDVHKRGLNSNQEKLSTSLKARCHWLAAVFCFWWSRQTDESSESEASEKACVYHVDKALECLASPEKNPVSGIFTPHLESPSRIGQHWKYLTKETLKSFKDDILASSVIVNARERFREVQKMLDSQQNNLVENERAKSERVILEDILKDLSDRYECNDLGIGSEQKEVLEDFLTFTKANRLLETKSGQSTASPLEMDSASFSKGELSDAFKAKWGSAMWDLVPCYEMPVNCVPKCKKPPLLTIMATCCSVIDVRNHASVLCTLLARLVLCALDQRSRSRMISSRGGRSSSSETFVFNDKSESDDSGVYEESEEEDALHRQGTLSSTNDQVRPHKRDLLILAAEFFVDKLTHISASLEVIPPNKVLVALLWSSLSFTSGMTPISQNRAISLSDYGNSESVWRSRAALERRLSSRHTLLHATRLMIRSVAHATKKAIDSSRYIEASYFQMMSKLLIQGRHDVSRLLQIKGDRRIRSMRSKALLVKADFVAVCLHDITWILSHHSWLFIDRKIKPSEMLTNAICTDIGDDDKSNVQFQRTDCQVECGVTVLVHVVDSVVWFWTYIMISDSGSDSKHGRLVEVSGSTGSVDKAICSRLEVPITAAIIALCGALGSSEALPLPMHDSQNMSSSEFSESDCSASERFQKCRVTERSEEDAETNHRSVLRTAFYMTRTIGLTFGRISETKVCALLSDLAPPIIPLLVSRIVATLSDLLLQELSERCDETKGGDYGPTSARFGVWSEDYPYGTRRIGEEIDSLLAKAYRCLHGFQLPAAQNHALSSCAENQHSCIGVNLDAFNCKFFPPESVKAAVQLYRCIKRAYTDGGRKTPPLSALECVSSALPKLNQSHSSAAILSFLYSNADRAEEQFELFEGVTPSHFPSWVFEQEEQNVESAATVGHDLGKEFHLAPFDGDQHSVSKEEVLFVWKAVCHEAAKGPLPKLDSRTDAFLFDHEKCNAIDQPTSESITVKDRDETSRYEVSLNKKFQAVLRDLCFSPLNKEGWIVAGQCLLSRAGLICDRMTPFKFGYDPEHFAPTERSFWSASANELNFDALCLHQDEEKAKEKDGWMPCIVDDISIFLSRPWSSYSALLACARDVEIELQNKCGTSIAESIDKGRTGLTHGVAAIDCFRRRQRENALGHLTKLRNEKKDGEWQNAWAGLWVQALRSIARGCFQAAYFLAKRMRIQSDTMREKEKVRVRAAIVGAEVCEAMGALLYSEAQAQIRYGFPIIKLCDSSKRDAVQTAGRFFERAMEWRRDAGENDTSLWDLRFMIGKCQEKMAISFRHQAFDFPSDVNSNISSPKQRRYEDLMSDALESYNRSLKSALEEEKKGTLPDAQVGGSSHGIPEIVYRLHTSRLKVLLTAVRSHCTIRKEVKEEALRLITQHWFDESQNTPNSESMKLNSFWDVFVDVARALSGCRRRNQYFHRSIYRHAQTLLWAPFIHNPKLRPSNKISRSSLPEEKALAIDGYDGISCESSAATIMETLFDKKRQQLCAVWVTTPTVASPFEVLNDSVRKYDTLRTKYTGAYIETLRLCSRIDSLESLFRSACSCERDLPGLYYASASTAHHEVGGTRSGLSPPPPPPHHHAKENLLDGHGYVWFTKRYANAAICDIIISQLTDFFLTSSSSKVNKESLVSLSGDRKRNFLMDYLGAAYSSFLRLNCSVGGVKSWALRNGRSHVLEAEALILSFWLVERERRGGGGGELPTGRRVVVLPNYLRNSWRDKAMYLQHGLRTCEMAFPERLDQHKGRKRRSRAKRSVDGSQNDEEEGNIEDSNPAAKKRKMSGEMSIMTTSDVT